MQQSGQRGHSDDGLGMRFGVRGSCWVPYGRQLWQRRVKQ